MLLAVDARNRYASLGFFEASGSRREARPAGRAPLLARRRIGGGTGRGADEYALLLAAFAEEAAGAAGAGATVRSAWMSSVAPAFSRELAKAIRSAFGLECSAVGPGAKTGVRIRTDIPSELGSDLVCAAAAARELVGGACIVVDFGDAISFSALGREGDFLGAAIAPGLSPAAESLRASTALLPEVPMDLPRAAIGKNTAQAVRAGVMLGYAGLIERITRRQREELVAAGEASSPGDIAIVGTGDEEGRALLEGQGGVVFAPDLVLEGIAIIAARNRPPQAAPDGV